MNQRGKQDPEHNSYTLYNAPEQKAPVFPGKPTTPNPYANRNQAVQRSLMEIFDEFTEVISGELKSMQLDEAEELGYKSEPRQP